MCDVHMAVLHTQEGWGEAEGMQAQLPQLAAAATPSHCATSAPLAPAQQKPHTLVQTSRAHAGLPGAIGRNCPLTMSLVPRFMHTHCTRLPVLLPTRGCQETPWHSTRRQPLQHCSPQPQLPASCYLPLQQTPHDRLHLFTSYMHVWCGWCRPTLLQEPAMIWHRAASLGAPTCWLAHKR